MKKLLTFLGKWLFEIIPVFIGVLLALYFSNIQEEKERIRFIENLKASIIHEIEVDIQDLDSSLIGEQIAIDTVLFYSENDSLSIYQILSKTGVISFPSLEFSTWTIIQSSGNAFVLNAELLREMVSMDIMINKHHIESINDITDFILANMFKNDRDSKMTMYMMMGNNYVMETSIRDELIKLKKIVEED